MGYGSVSYEPFTSLQAHLKIVDVEETDGKFEDTPKQVMCEFEVLDYEEAEDDDNASRGWTFRDWFGFSVDKKIGAIGISKSPKAKLPNLIKAALHPDGEKVIARGEFEATMLKDREIRAWVVRSGKNEDGDHSRLKAESIFPKPRKAKSSKASEEKTDAEAQMEEAPF